MENGLPEGGLVGYPQWATLSGRISTPDAKKKNSTVTNPRRQGAAEARTRTLKSGRANTSWTNYLQAYCTRAVRSGTKPRRERWR